MSSPSSRRKSGWVVGHVAGAPVIVAPSWLLAVGVLTFLYADTARALTGLSGSAVYVVALSFVVLLFASVFLHELAHGLVARSRGQQPREFVLTLWGGHTSFDAVSATPATSALISVAGPVVNLVLAAAFFVPLRLDLLEPHTVLWALMWSGAAANGFVGLFNLVPALPLDGGRVLEAIVWATSRDRLRGTIVAGWCGRVFAVGFVAWALLASTGDGGEPDFFLVAWCAIIGAFLWSGASAAIKNAHVVRRVDGVTLSSVARRAVTVGASDSVAHAGAVAATGGAQEVVVLSPDGRPAAYVDRAAAAAVPAEVAGTTPVTAVSVPLPVGASVDGQLSGRALVDDVGRATRYSPVVAVLVDGRVIGLIRATDVIAALRP
ncbi:site-2 protease family protein [Cellulomonas composti]|nr:site-2 protease family protein [Cellulomonas composti]